MPLPLTGFQILFVLLPQCGQLQLWNKHFRCLMVNLGGWFHGWLISWLTVFFHAVFLELLSQTWASSGALLCAVQWTSRMLGCWITLFGLSVCWLAGADADNAGVGWALGPVWAVARLAVQHQAWLDSLRHYQSSYWLWKVAVFAKNILRPACHSCWTWCERVGRERQSGGLGEVTAAEECPNWCGRTVGEGGRVPTGDCQLDAMMQTIEETQRH